MLAATALAHGPLGPAEEALAGGDLETAQEIAEHAFHRGGRKRRVEAASLLATIWLARHEPVEAARVLAPVANDERAALEVAEVRQALIEASEAARVALDSERVILLCEVAQALGPLPGKMQFDRGWAALMLGDIALAARDLEAAFDALPVEERPFVASLVSEVRRDGSPELALDFASEGLVNPGEFETDLRLLRGLAAWESGELDVARDELAWLHTDRPTAVHAAWLGQIEVARGESDAAIALFEQCIRMAPGMPEGWMGLAVALESTEDPARRLEARGALRRAAQLAPYDADVLTALVLLLKATGQDAQARPLEERIQLLALPE